MPRLFYLTGHNTNSVEQAVRCLEAGANALEPDVSWEPKRGRFYVHEKIPPIPDWILRLFRKSLTLDRWLDRLREYLARSGRASQLALVILDMKPPYTYDLGKLGALVRDAFSAFLPDVAILVTCSDPDAMAWLATLAPTGAPTGVGVDENSRPGPVDAFFRPGRIRYTYANGTSVPLLPTTCWLGDVRAAIPLRAEGTGRGFSLVYAWTVNARCSMIRFLDAGVDGLITDKVERLRDLLATKYAGSYELAAAGDDPFPPLPPQDTGTT